VGGEESRPASSSGERPVANVCDPNYTFLAKVAKRYLPRVDAYGGMHGHLTEAAHAYRAGRA
jgi:amidase